MEIIQINNAGLVVIKRFEKGIEQYKNSRIRDNILNVVTKNFFNFIIIPPGTFLILFCMLWMMSLFVI